ncbi:MAG: S8 family serine peptidase [Gammaproteobacteria bacterium]|nr:S8 family serine peptidase [Gammaproteobacteria bacterium]
MSRVIDDAGRRTARTALARLIGAAALAAPGAVMAQSPPAPGDAAAAVATLERFVASACAGDAAQVAGARLVGSEPLVVRGHEVGWRRRYVLDDGTAQVLLDGIAPGGGLRRVRAQLDAVTPGRLSPRLLILADGECRAQLARRLVYGADGRAEYLEQLADDLATVAVREPLDAPVPQAPAEPADPGGVPVAMVDAGVNYLLPEISARLARDASGRALGYDYWDMDERPFDAHPAHSPFFPQRHGTRTASAMLNDAPVARVVPYRYPRPDMGRMAELIGDAARNGVVIVNMSLGNRDAAEWDAFARAARANPQMLFVVSAGNDGLDIDSQPIYPAALNLDNVLTVTSARADGRLAEGSNWGRESVDVMLPAEERVVTDFHGRATLVSGSSYAAARASALAACLLGANPGWRAPELKSALLEMAAQPEDEARRVTAHGFIAEPSRVTRGACPAARTAMEEISRIEWGPDDLAAPAPGVPVSHALELELVVFADAGRDPETLRRATARVAEILGQCGVAVRAVVVRVVDGPARYRYFRYDWATEMLAELALRRPAVLFVKDLLIERDYETEAIAIGHSGIGRRWQELNDTVWVTAALDDLGIGLAHELYHVLADSGRHDTDPANLMFDQTSADNTRLRASQCVRMLRVGEAFGTLKRVP